MINGLTEDEVGFYNLAIFNDAGSVITGKAKLSLISSDAKMTDDLVTHIKFDESNGSSASNSLDLIPFPVELFDDYGDPNEEPTGSEGLIGKSITVNGPDQEFYAFGLMANYTKITDEGSVSVWFNTSGLDSNAVILRNGSVLNRESENQFEIGLNLNDEGDAFLVAAVTAGPNVIRLSNSEPIELEEWNHAGLTIDGGQIRLYQNGNVVAVTDYLDRVQYFY